MTQINKNLIKFITPVILSFIFYFFHILKLGNDTIVIFFMFDLWKFENYGQILIAGFFASLLVGTTFILSFNFFEKKLNKQINKKFIICFTISTILAIITTIVCLYLFKTFWFGYDFTLLPARVK